MTVATRSKLSSTLYLLEFAAPLVESPTTLSPERRKGNQKENTTRLGQFTYESIEACLSEHLTIPYSPDVSQSKLHLSVTCTGGECGIPFYKRYQMPSDYLKLWYSFEVGPTHNLVFSTELDYSRGSEQFNFILNVSQPPTMM